MLLIDPGTAATWQLVLAITFGVLELHARRKKVIPAFTPAKVNGAAGKKANDPFNMEMPKDFTNSVIESSFPWLAPDESVAFKRRWNINKLNFRADH